MLLSRRWTYDKVFWPRVPTDQARRVAIEGRHLSLQLEQLDVSLDGDRVARGKGIKAFC